MNNLTNVLYALIFFALLGGLFGFLLAVAAKAFTVKVDPRVEKVSEILPGANCGGCGYAGCNALAEAIVKGEAKTNACNALGDESIAEIAGIVGAKAEKSKRMRAQVMCSGTLTKAKRKYIYRGTRDCNAAIKLFGGEKICPNGCVGLGSCVKACAFGAISVIDGVAVVDDRLCTGCGQCQNACPKHIIKLIPFDALYEVACMSVDKGALTRSYCDAGCIACKICEKNCPAGAITVNDFVASIEYDKCTGCGICAEKCPRKIIDFNLKK